MERFLIRNAASFRIDEIYTYTLERWGATKAESYISGLFVAFEKIAAGELSSHPIPAEFGIDGFFFRYEKHFVYWKYLSHGVVGITTILHERMHQIERFKEDFSVKQI
ncbi:MAG: type II toxin-antitoxin system RelE/ParE family toxin [Xanthomonadales bacterium]|nr:type II toxin-antitoxin system RelE/ParE family toxin [Xanthomonadales bacterium]